jgi:hypothetical protein
MVAWHTPRWFLPTVIAGILTLAVVDIMLLRRSKPATVSAPSPPEKIGLNAQDEGDALRLQWDRKSRPIRDASRAVLYIHDGNNNSQLELTDRQLAAASVRYWPDADSVTFRMDVFHWDGNSSETVTAPRPLQRVKKSLRLRAVVDQVRPSPFERGRAPETAQGSADRVAPPPREAPELVKPEPPKESRLGRMFSKIPLLRRLRKHSESDDSKPPAVAGHHP